VDAIGGADQGHIEMSVHDQQGLVLRYRPQTVGQRDELGRRQVLLAQLHHVHTAANRSRHRLLQR